MDLSIEIPGSLGRDAYDAFVVRFHAIYETHSNDGRIEMTITYRGQDYDCALIRKSIGRVASQHNGEITRVFSTGVRLTFPTLLDSVEFVKTCGVTDMAVVGTDQKFALSFDEPVNVSLTHLGYLIGADEMHLPI